MTLRTVQNDRLVDGAKIDNLPSDTNAQLATKLDSVVAGANISVDNTDPNNPVISSSGGSGSGDVTKVGTPVNNQIGVWTGDGTIEGDSDLTWNGSTFTAAGTGSSNLVDLTQSGSGTTLNINNSGSGDFIVVDTNKMVLDNSGNLSATNLSGTNTGDQTAATTPNTPAGSISSNTVQGAINELDTEKLTTVSVSSEFSGDGTSGSPLDFSTDNKTLQGFFNGATLDDVQGDITSDGVTVTAELEKLGGGDVKYKTSSGVSTIDCTPPATVTLTPGSDTVPTKNYMYIDAGTGLFTANTTGYPASEHVPLSTAIIGSAGFVQTDGTYATHQWNDHVTEVGDNGHLTHINAWIRNQNATWTSGLALSETGSGTSTVNTSLASGEMFQLHDHVTPAIASPAPMYIINDETTPYTKITNLADITTDTTGASINNKYISLVVWYAYSQITGDSKLYINKPSGSYSSESDARADGQKYADFSINEDFRGTGILIKRLITRLSGGNVTIYPGAGDDLRGTLPNTASGSSTSVSSTFLDSAFEVQNVTDSTKIMDFDVSGVTTGTTRTLTIQDKDITIADNADVALKAPLASPTFTGTPSLPTGTTGVTQSASDNSTKLATTAYVDAAAGGGGAFSTTSNVTSNTPGAPATDDFVFGSTQLDDIVVTALYDSRYFFDKSKGAFRAGTVNGSEWDDVNRGTQSTAFGFQCTASGNKSFAAGSNATASGDESIAMGANVTASGSNCSAFGNNTTASGGRAAAFGSGTLASADRALVNGDTVDCNGAYSFATGEKFKNDQDYSVAVGLGSSITDLTGVAVRLEADADQNASGKPAIFIQQGTAPTTTTDRLYNVAGNLYWNGTQLN